MNKLIGVVATTIISAGLSFSALADKVTLKFHTMVPMPANSNAKFVKPWADKVKKESNGEIITEMYPSMQLGGKPPQLVDQAREGVVDIVWTVAGYTPGRFPRLSVFELPFMPTSAKITAQAVQEFVETAGAEDLKDYKILAVHVHAPGMIHTKKTLIKSVSDFKGLKLRGPTRSATSLLKKLGATPVGMPIPKVAPSLSKGVITGMVVPWEIMPSFKLQELTKSHTNVAGNRGLYTTPFLFVMNKAKYDSLSPAHKKVIDNNSGMSLARQAGVLWDDFEGPARALAVKAGGEFHTLSGAPLAEIKKAADQVIQDWIKDANSKGLDGQKLYDTAKSLIKKYEKTIIIPYNIMIFWKKIISSKIRPDNQFGRILNFISRYFAIFGGFILLTAALISIFSIFGRVVFSSPILGDFELVEIACAVAIGSFLPLCHLKNGNVIVDFITAKLSKNKINLLDSISSLIFGVVALFFSSRMILGAKDMYVYQEETMLLAFPIWLPFLPVIASFFLLTICCFYTFIIKINLIIGK